jgi:hypothetical protein
MGHAATVGRGGGTCNVLSCTSLINCRTESPIELNSSAVGATTRTTAEMKTAGWFVCWSLGHDAVCAA